MPASVPSLRHSSHPCTPSFAPNRNTPPRAPTSVGLVKKGEVDEAALLMLRRNTLPATVPSLVQGSGTGNSAETCGGVAAKYSRPPIDVISQGDEPSGPGRRSSATVPAAVPSLVQSSRPYPPSSAEK